MKHQATAPQEAAGPAASPFNFRDRDGNPLPRHPREGGDPAPPDEANPQQSGLDSRLRGSDGTSADPEAAHIPSDAELAEPMQRKREDGWTPPRMRMFLMMLSSTGNVAECCRELGRSRQSAYRLRRHNPTFARAWDGAILRSREVYIDECWQRAMHGSTEEVVVDGRLVERQGKASDAMLRYLLNRLDKRADSAALAAKPAQEAEKCLEELIDCLDPENANPMDGDIPEEKKLMEEIEATAQPHPTAPEDDFLLQRLEIAHRYQRLKAMRPEDVDISDLDPEKRSEWTDEQWERADHSGLLATIDWGDEEEEYEADHEDAARQE